MCGYCAEQLALDISTNGLNVDSCDVHQLELCLFLQESTKIDTALKIADDFFNDPLDPVIADVILCRLLLYLFENGYGSEYQKLLQYKSVQQAIETGCSLETREAVSGLSFPFVNHLLKLYDPATYQNKQVWDRLTNEKTLDSNYLHALQFFVDWWLKGKRLAKNPPNFSSNAGTIVDHLFERDDEECRKFELSFRLVFFSLLLVSGTQKDHPLIHDLITTNPAYMPDLFGLDLWLQRVAVKLNGISAQASSKRPRPELIEYAKAIETRQTFHLALSSFALSIHC